MRKIEEVLRLRAAVMSPRQIAASIPAGKSTLYEHLARADTAGIGWPLPEGMDEAALQAKLFPQAAGPRLAAPRPGPDSSEIHKELKSKRHVTLRLLWLQFKQANLQALGTASSAPTTPSASDSLTTRVGWGESLVRIIGDQLNRYRRTGTFQTEGTVRRINSIQAT